MLAFGVSDPRVLWTPSRERVIGKGLELKRLR